MSNIRRIAILWTVTFLAGCGLGGPINGPLSDAEQALARDPSAFRAFYADATHRTYDPAHGTQVEYYTADGRTFLWYPGNQRPVPGYWKVQALQGGVAGMCFLYGTNTYNPVTRERGGRWECSTAFNHLDRNVETVAGDPFGLAGGRVPFALPGRQNLTLARLYERHGRNPTRLRPKLLSAPRS